MDELIDVFLDTAQDAGGWEPALAVLRERFGARQTVLYSFVGGMPSRAPGFDVAASSREQWSFDPAPGAAAAGIEAAVRLVAEARPRGRAGERIALVTRRVRVAGLGSGLLMHGSGDAVRGVLGIFPGQARSIPRADVSMLRAFMPHVLRSLKVRLRYRAMAARSRSLERACELLSVGVLQTDVQARPLWANAAARKELASGDALTVVDGRLSTRRVEDSRLLRSLLVRDGTHRGSDRRRVRLGLVHRGERRVPMLAYVIPASPSGDSPSAGTALGEDTATLFVIDPAHARQASPTLLRDFAFTPAEATVAARMLGGLGVEALASDLGVTRQTVRQHLKRVFEKTATHRQAELLMVLASAVGWFRGAQES